MFDLNKLSYKAYGEFVIVLLIILALLFNLSPFSLNGFFLCIIEIPIYLTVRANFKDPIHAIGLNICFFLTLSFYCFLYATIKICVYAEGLNFAFMVSSLLNMLGCYATSTVPNDKEEKGKYFFGRKKEDGRYADLFRLIKYDPTNNEICKYEDRLKETDNYRYLIFKYIFREEKTWDETMDLLDIYERKDLDKEIYAIYRILQYACDLKRID